MRTINANALAFVNQQYGNEPANIIKFAFGTYCDKKIPQVEGKILELSSLDAVVNISSSSDSQEITVVLDDTDGTIKTYMETHDLHLTEATIYQWFDGLDYSDKFVLFKGQINSPISWNEGERTVSLTVISKLEDVEIGFSPEEGQFTGLGNDYIGRAWPMCFGEVNSVSALQLNQRIKGVTADGFGMVDAGLLEQVRIGAATRATGNFNAQDKTTWTPEMCLAEKLKEQQATVKPGINIFNGEYFPKGTIWLDFGRCIVQGYFTGHYFTFTSQPQYNPNSGSTVGFCGMDDNDVVCGSAYSAYIDGNTGQTGLTKEEICNGMSAMSTAQSKVEQCGFMYVAPGTNVRLYDDEKIYYAVSCVPGTIKQVTSDIQTMGESFPQTVNTSLWTQENWDLGNGLTGVVVVIDNALSKQMNPLLECSWSDDILVTFESAVGPNTADILKYIIETYSNKTISGYTETKNALTNYPSDFAIYSRPNIITALQDIAWQARCSIIYKDDVFYLNYLPAAQPSRDTITEADILENTLAIEYTETEDIITKMECLWEESGTQEDPNKVILRNNISKYGTKTEEFDFYIYNYIDAVLKGGTYWLIKYSNTWKRVRFETPISKLALETMDYITLDLSSLADEPVLCLIEEVWYNSNNHSLAFTCFAPVKAGTMVEYPYAYPANLGVNVTYPDADEFDVWKDSEAINKLTSGNLSMTSIQYYGNRTTPDPYRNASGSTKFTENHFADIDRRESDRGIRHISDTGDKHPGILILRSTPTMSEPDKVH